ncbi:O-antigen ligase family protein [Candidatus Microgenomates bacterium]|nr:O-antigen ligase family protein [Candidatus Microgenomates bacterium]
MPRTQSSQQRKLTKRLSDILIVLFVFFLPTQLGKHFFLPFSYISGVRVDYLAPAIYVTDILAFLLILTHLNEYRAILKNKTVQMILFLLSLTLIVSLSRDFGLYKFLKVIELLAIGGIFASPQTNKKTVFYAFFWTALLQLYIVLMQMVSQHSLGGDFYFLGERPLTLSMPGIAKAAIDGVQMLRPYGTFSHPNSMAGFFVAIYAYYLFHRLEVKPVAYWALILISAALAVFSFSKIAISVFFIVTLYYLMKQKKLGGNGSLRMVLITIITFVCALFFKASTDPLTVSKRLTLALDSISIIKSHWLLGVGLGNYLYAQGEFPQNYPSFILQPVHNIVLLTAAELGIPISSYLLFLIFRYISKKRMIALPILCILATGMFDHYWLTLQQNWLLLGVMWGLLNTEVL